MKEGSEILPDSDLDKEEKEEDSQIKNSKFRNISQLGIAQKETETIVLNPETLDLDSYYLLLKRNLRYLPTDKETGENIKQKLFERLFIRYEHKDSPFYLYATSEALQTNINMLLDSELGKLFDTKNAKCSRCARNCQSTKVSLRIVQWIDLQRIYPHFSANVSRRRKLFCF